jgi:hypothetical protein
MISDDDQKYILTRAYVPEHSVDLMTRVSGGEPFLINDYFCCRRSDYFYTLDMEKFTLKSALKRVVNNALENLSVERSTAIGEPHDELAREFIKRVNPPPRVRELLSKMSIYVGPAAQSVVLNAWDDAQ